jgi:protein-disulfide isomerase
MSKPWFVFACVCVIAGCASSPAPEAKTAAAAAPDAQAAAAACDHFADQLCEQLGTDTETCAAMRSVREWLPAKACVAADADLDQALARVSELRKSCDDLAVKLCAELGADTEGCADVRRDMPHVPAGHCKVLLAHSAELVDQIREKQARDKPLDDAVWKELLAGAPPSFGPDTAKVTIVEFSDFQCPYCAQAAKTVEAIRARYADKVHLVFREYPLSFHPYARGAAQAAVAAHQQGKFWALHDAMFAHQGALDRASLDGYAKDGGLDVAKFKHAMDADPSLDAAIQADLELGKKVGVDGTPTMFLNGKRVENPTDVDAVTELVEDALK